MNEASKPIIDLENFDTVKDSNAGATIELYHPGTNVNLGIFIDIVGRDSTEFRKFTAQQNRRRIAKMSKGGSFKLQALSQEEMEEDSVMLLAACTKGWRCPANPDEKWVLDGKPLEFSQANAELVYERFPWIREQVDVAVGDRALFTKS